MGDASRAAKMVKGKLAELGWNHADLARALEKKGVVIHKGAVSRWLRGERGPDRERSAAIQELFPEVAVKLWTKTRPKSAKKRKAA